MPPKGKSIQTPRKESKLYIGKAEQFLDAARAAAAGSQHDAAMLNAIHAGVTACDAVTTALAGLRSADPDHQRATDLLEQVGGSSTEIKEKVRQLRSLISKKNEVSYESRRATAKEARESVARAGRIVEWAAETVQRAKF